MTDAPLTIDIVSDVVCPWCYLGKANLEAALTETREIPVAIRWRPFQLDPTVPEGGMPWARYVKERFGDTRKFAEAQQRLVELGRARGITYRFDLVARAVNTIDAHRVIHWAGEAGGVAGEATVVDRLFKLNFTEGADIGDHQVLADAASEAGLDREETLRRLATDRDRQIVLANIAAAQRAGVTGVPCFIFAGRYAVMGAQPPELLARAVRQAAAAPAPAPAGA